MIPDEALCAESLAQTAGGTSVPITASTATMSNGIDLVMRPGYSRLRERNGTRRLMQSWRNSSMHSAA
ncbi:MAG: hypothetical protein K0R61_5229 [Microvirga sp.]|nr:hypothetical protein [Microvirga sp.]